MREELLYGDTNGNLKQKHQLGRHNSFAQGAMFETRVDPVALTPIKEALNPDPRTEADFEVDDNRFAFSPGQLNKLLNPKSLTAFHALGGLQGLERCLLTGLGKTQQAPFVSNNAPTRLLNAFAGLENPTTKTIHVSSGDSLVTKQFFAEGVVNGISVEAQVDSGADKCFISPELVARIGLAPAPGSEEKIFLPNKKYVQSLGKVQVPWKFAREKKSYVLDCWIIPECVHDLALGNPFLRMTKTLTKVKNLKNRIKARIFQLSRQVRLSLLGEQSQRMWGSLNGHPIAALPDTGSDLMLVSGLYAERKGFTVDRGPQNWLQVEYANGTTSQTSGVVRNLPWKVGGKTVVCDFYVLDELCVDVILSGTYLFDFNVFSESAQFFFDVNSEDFSHFCNVRLIGRYSDNLNLLEEESWGDLNSPDAFGAEMVQRELARRDKIREEILLLPEDEQEQENQAETERQHQWESQKKKYRKRYRDALSMPQERGHGITHIDETYRCPTRPLQASPLNGTADYELQRSFVRKKLWKRKASHVLIPLQSIKKRGVGN